MLTAPVLVWAETLQHWLGYTAPTFPGSGLLAPVLGSAVFLYGGWPFLTGRWSEARARRPGMMLPGPLAAGVLAWAGFVLPMSVGAALMSLSTIIVAVNAQLLRRVELRPQPT